jgi:hypothetical protein
VSVVAVIMTQMFLLFRCATSHAPVEYMGNSITLLILCYTKNINKKNNYFYVTYHVGYSIAQLGYLVMQQYGSSV